MMINRTKSGAALCAIQPAGSTTFESSTNFEQRVTCMAFNIDTDRI